MRMKKRLSIILMILLVMVPTLNVYSSRNVYADENKQFIDVKTSNASLKSGAYKYADTIAKTYSGRVLNVKGVVLNEYGHLWYKVAWENEPGDGNVAYIYAENVEKHVHSYVCKEVENVQYSYCNCGDVYVEETSEKMISRADTLVLGATATGAATSVIDGPLPVGDLIGVVLVAGTRCLEYSGIIPSEIQQITTEKEFCEYIKENGEVCTEDNFRMVRREKGLLFKVDEKCLTISQAYVYARYCKGDVWTPDETGQIAEECAALNKDFFGPEVDKDQPGYYYHYHFGKDHKTEVGGHVFFGKGQFLNYIPQGE